MPKKSKQLRPIPKVIKELQKQFSNYSVQDIAETLFISSLWLPNISSWVKYHLLYAAFISMKPDSFSLINKIKEYYQFKALLDNLYSLLPSFSHMEDYVPELDWGDVKFYHEERIYRLFYGCNIESIYDFLYAFQILFASLDEPIKNVTQRSPSDELEACLKLQHTIISSIKIKKEEIDLENVVPGYLEVPSNNFWSETKQYYNSFDSLDFVPSSILRDYSIPLGSSEFVLLLQQHDFLELVSNGDILDFFFIKNNEKYYSVFPRKFSEVLLQNWSKIFNQYSQQLLSEIDYEKHLTIEISRFLSERYYENHLFSFASPVSNEGYPEEPVFSSAIHARDRLVLVYLAKPIWNRELAQEEFETLAPKLNRAIDLLQATPTTLALHGRKENIVFSSEKNKNLQIEIITVVPSISIDGIGFRIPEKMPGRIIFMHDFLALFDEFTDFNELDSFYTFLDTTESQIRMPFYSMMDKFGAFRDFNGIIVNGAREFDLISLDPHWGSNQRYKTLKEFWQLYPILNNGILGNPRSWSPRIFDNQRVSLITRHRLGRTLICKVGNTHILINSPLDKLPFEKAKGADLLTEMVEDSIYLNLDILSEHNFFQRNNVLLITIFPSELVKSDSDFDHLRHLLIEGKNWDMDKGIPAIGVKGIAIVFDEQFLTEYLINVVDRTLESELLYKLLQQIDGFIPSPNLEEILKRISNYKERKPRFKMTAFEKIASFPELISSSKPTEYDHKAAGKFIAQTALSNELHPRNYELIEAKQFLNKLRSALVREVNQLVQRYSFVDAVPFLITKIDALIDENFRATNSLEASLEHEVEFDRAKYGAKSETEFRVHYRAYRYIIEKFVQLTPQGNEFLEEPEFQFLSALILKLLRIYDASDSINYQAYPVGVTVDDDYIVNVSYSVDVDDMQKTYQKELSEIELGLIGFPADQVESPTPVHDFLNTIDSNFKSSLGFRFWNMIAVLQILSMWPSANDELEDKTYYYATSSEITTVCEHRIEDFDNTEIDKILTFLTLKPEQMLVIQDQTELCEDLPIWEYYKRPGRYSIRPLIAINETYYWGAHSANRSGRVWASALVSGKLPFDIQSLEIKATIDAEKSKIEKALVEKAENIVRHFTSLVETNLELHKRDRKGNHPTEIGDYDVIAYIPNSNLLVNIECKDILPAFCLKDDSRVRRKFFGSGNENDRGFLGKVEKRGEYLSKNANSIMAALGWKPLKNKKPKIISMFVSRRSYWWTRFPPVKTQVQFLTTDMLREYLNKIIL